MSDWTHRTCERCFFDGPSGVMSDGRFRVPVQVTEDDPSACCTCGGWTITSIYTRANPKGPTVLCGGDHENLSWSRIAPWAGGVKDA